VLLHGASVPVQLFGGFDGSDADVEPIRVVAPHEPKVVGGQAWRALDHHVARDARRRALNAAPLPVDAIEPQTSDDDDDADADFEQIERSVAVQDGAVRLLQLERENRRLRAALQVCCCCCCCVESVVVEILRNYIVVVGTTRFDGANGRRSAGRCRSSIGRHRRRRCQQRVLTTQQ
jgi:hypothetical protein